MSEEVEAEAEAIEGEPVTELAVTRIDAELHEFQMVQRWGKLAAASGYFPDVRAETADQMIAQAAIKVMTGRELGFSTIASISGVHIIDGKPVLGANMIAIALKSSAKYDYRVVEHTNLLCEIDIFEFLPDGTREKIGTSQFTMGDAEQAGLTRKDNWVHYPRNMLFARAMSNGVAWHAPDVFSTRVYTPDEMGLIVDAAGEVDVKALPAPAEATATPAARATPEPAKPAEPPPPPDPAKIDNAGDFMIWATHFVVANRMPRPTSADIANMLGLATVGAIAPEFKADWAAAVAKIQDYGAEPEPPEPDEQPAAAPEQPAAEEVEGEPTEEAEAPEQPDGQADAVVEEQQATDGESATPSE